MHISALLFPYFYFYNISVSLNQVSGLISSFDLLVCVAVVLYYLHVFFCSLLGSSRYFAMSPANFLPSQTLAMIHTQPTVTLVQPPQQNTRQCLFNQTFPTILFSLFFFSSDPFPIVSPKLPLPKLPPWFWRKRQDLTTKFIR